MKSDKDKAHVILLIYGIFKNNINELIYKTEIESDVENKFIVTRGDSGGELEGLGDKLGAGN